MFLREKVNVLVIVKKTKKNIINNICLKRLRNGKKINHYINQFIVVGVIRRVWFMWSREAHDALPIFGDSSMTDFKRGASKEQRKSYLARSGGIKNKQGKLTKNDKNSANYWSRKINW
jgi:hypothetical protein